MIKTRQITVQEKFDFLKQINNIGMSRRDWCKKHGVDYFTLNQHLMRDPRPINLESKIYKLIMKEINKIKE